MAFTMHSHSGQFCPGHAKHQLEDIVKHAISLGYKTMGLTEHMPRYDEQDLYPEELDDPDAIASLASRHESYLVEAQRLQEVYAPQIHILIAFEAEFIRPSYAGRVEALRRPACVDYFIGSVHHVHGVPIDYDAATYARAVEISGSGSGAGSEEALQGDYYDLQHEMLLALRPRVVGHFDLVRLLASEPNADPRTRWGDEGGGVWDKVRRNLEVVRSQGGWLECNTAALRKGLDEPYPGRAIAEEWVRMGGKFTMSDDSHGIDHVATNYSRALTYLESLGVTELWTFRRTTHPGLEDGQRAVLEEVAVPVAEFRRSFPK